MKPILLTPLLGAAKTSEVPQMAWETATAPSTELPHPFAAVFDQIVQTPDPTAEKEVEVDVPQADETDVQADQNHADDAPQVAIAETPRMASPERQVTPPQLPAAQVRTVSLTPGLIEIGQLGTGPVPATALRPLPEAAAVAAPFQQPQARAEQTTQPLIAVPEVAVPDDKPQLSVQAEGFALPSRGGEPAPQPEMPVSAAPSVPVPERHAVEAAILPPVKDAPTPRAFIADAASQSAHEAPQMPADKGVPVAENASPPMVSPRVPEGSAPPSEPWEKEVRTGEMPPQTQNERAELEPRAVQAAPTPEPEAAPRSDPQSFAPTAPPLAAADMQTQPGDPLPEPDVDPFAVAEPAAPRAPSGQIVQSAAKPALPPQVMPHLTELATGRADQIDITLSPEELGKVRLAATQTENGVVLVIQAERPETLDLMRRNISDLLGDLQDLGFADINYSDGQSKDQTASDAQPGGGDPADSPDIPMQSQLLPQGGLDLRL